jgi:GT2 family glycosyltransferase
VKNRRPNMRPLPVYLIHFDRPAWCASAVASIRQSRGLVIDLTVINNGPQPHKQLVDQIPRGTRVLSVGENRGYTGGANVALRDWMARFPDGELCAIASHDLHVEFETFERLVELAEEHPEAGVVAPALVAPNPAAGGFWDGRVATQRPPNGTTALVRCDWASGTCLLLRRACVEQVGPFDERLGSYCEDVDYGLRAGDAGWAVLVAPAVRASGLGTSSSGSWGMRAANTILLNAKRHGRGTALESFCACAVSAARGILSGALPWRDRDRREHSRLVAGERAAALVELVRSGRLTEVLRSPEVGSW